MTDYMVDGQLQQATAKVEHCCKSLACMLKNLKVLMPDCDDLHLNISAHADGYASFYIVDTHGNSYKSIVQQGNADAMNEEWYEMPPFSGTYGEEVS